MSSEDRGFDNQPDDKFSQDNNGQDYTPYPEVNHPEDRPDFGYTNNYGAYSANSNQYDAAGGAGYGGAGGVGGGEDRHYYLYDPMVDTLPGDARVSIMDAIRYGFRVTFKNPLLWILGTFAFMTIVFGLSFITSFTMYVGTGVAESEVPVNPLGDPTSWLSMVFSLLIAPWLIHLALTQINGGKMDKSVIFSAPRYGRVFVSYLLIYVVELIVIGALTALTVGTATTIDTANASAADWMPFMLLMLGMVVVGLILQPLLMFAPYLAYDERASSVASIKESVSLGVSNFLKVIGYTIVVGVISVLMTLLSCGLLMVIAVPMAMNAQAYLYRQLVNGRRPIEQRG